MYVSTMILSTSRISQYNILIDGYLLCTWAHNSNGKTSQIQMQLFSEKSSS